MHLAVDGTFNSTSKKDFLFKNVPKVMPEMNVVMNESAYGCQ